MLTVFPAVFGLGLAPPVVGTIVPGWLKEQPIASAMLLGAAVIAGTWACVLSYAVLKPLVGLAGKAAVPLSDALSRVVLNPRVLFLALLEALMFPALFLVAWSINTEGLRSFHGYFTYRLAKLPVPWIYLLERTRSGSKLDLAHPLAVVLFVGTMLAWVWLMRLILSEREFEFSWRSWFTCAGTDQQSRKDFVLRMVATALLVSDLTLFLAGYLKTAGGPLGGGFPPIFSGLVLTKIYASTLLFAAYVHVRVSE